MQSTVLVFTLSVTVMLLLTYLTSAPDDKSIGIEYCQKICEKVSLIAILILHMKSIADRRPLPVCIQCHLQTTPSLCQPRSSHRASLSSQQLQSAGFFCGRPCDMELVTRQSERPGHQQRLLQMFTKDVFIFSLLVYIVH